jgi:hypothetical protein
MEWRPTMNLICTTMRAQHIGYNIEFTVHLKHCRAFCWLFMYIMDRINVRQRENIKIVTLSKAITFDYFRELLIIQLYLY